MNDQLQHNSLPEVSRDQQLLVDANKTIDAVKKDPSVIPTLRDKLEQDPAFQSVFVCLLE